MVGAETLVTGLAREMDQYAMEYQGIADRIWREEYAEEFEKAVAFQGSIDFPFAHQEVFPKPQPLYLSAGMKKIHSTCKFVLPKRVLISISYT
jgi:hypothetical protein